MRFDWDELVREKIAVDCPDDDSARSFFNEVAKQFPEAANAHYTDGEHLIYRGISTAYDLELYCGGDVQMCFGDVDWYERNGYRVISFTDLFHAEDFGEIDTGGASIEFLFGTLEVAE